MPVPLLFLEIAMLALSLAGLGAFAIPFLKADMGAAPPAIRNRLLREAPGAWLNRDRMMRALIAVEPLVAFCSRRFPKPHALTLSTALLGIIAGFALGFGLFWTALLPLLMAGLLDLLDGAVARRLNRTSTAGALLDSAVDRYVEFFFHAGLLVSLAGHALGQLLVVFALFGAFMVTYSTAKGEIHRFKPATGVMKRGERVASWILVIFLAGLIQVLGFSPAGWLAFSAAGIGALCHLSAAKRFAAIGQTIL